MYEQQLRQNIATSTRFVLQHHRQPDQLHPHLNSFWEQLRQVRFRPALYDLAVELIAALYPWPTRWGNWDEWERQVRFAIYVMARQNDLTRQAQFSGYLAQVLFHTGRSDETLLVIEQAIQLARAGHSFKKQFEQALQYCQHRLDMTTRLNYPGYVVNDRINRAYIRLHLGQTELSFQELQGLWDDETVQSSPELKGRCAAILSRCYMLLGQRDEAQRAAKCALDISMQNDMRVLHVTTLRCLAQVELPEKAVILLHQALSLANELNRRFDQAACLLSLAGLMKDQEAQACAWDEGSRLLQEMGAAAWLEDCSPQNPPFLPLVV